MRIALSVVAVLLGLALQPVPAQAQQPLLEQARRATAAYHDVHKAEAAHYEKFLDCFGDPEKGGMGQHYVNGRLVDGTLDPAAPEALVYEMAPSGLRLVAVEYLIEYKFAPREGPAPRLFGTEFHPKDEIGVWALHAWIWRPNPSGMHADYNPRVARCIR